MRALPLTLPLLLLLCACEKEKEPVPAAALATLTEAHGQVSVQRGTETRAGGANQPLYQGDTLVTGPASEALVRYVNGVEIQVEENSRFRINGVPGKLTLELEEGRIISTAPKDANSGLTVKGRFGQAEIVTAAEIVFDLRSERPRLKLEYGEIRVIDQEGKPVPVVVAEEIEFVLKKPQPAAPQQVVVAEEIVFFLQPRNGKARVRGAKESGFSEVAADQTVQLGPGAAFEVPAQASARLSSNELQVLLGGDTAGTLTSAARQGEQRSYSLQLSRGTAQLQFAPGSHRLKLADARGEFELKVTEQSAISVRGPQEGSTVTVLTGQVELTTEGKATVVKAGEAVNRSASTPGSTPATAPALLLPSNAKVRVFADELSEAGLRLPEGTGGPLRVEVATEPTFREPLLAGRAGSSWVRMTPPTRGELHWRFLTEDGAVREQGSARFQPDKGRSSLSSKSPRADVMETGRKASVYFQGATPALHFNFDARAGARAYRIRVYRANNPRTPLLDRAASRTEYTLEPGALGEGHYLWYVAALGPNGEELTGGRMNKLELVYDNARRGLAISRPRKGERPGSNGVPLEGVAPIGSRLFVNGQPVTLDTKGRFSQRVPPAQVLVFRLVSEQGEAYWVRTLRSDR